jgi:hypothetical protein
MSRAKIARAGLLVAGMWMLAQAPGAAQDRALPKPTIRPPATGGAMAKTFTPRFEALAETRLLMEGLALSNYRGVQRLLKGKAPDVETWTFARGQALLIAETGNLLMLRPPRNSGRDTWMRLATDLREKATGVARAAADRDLAKCKLALEALTASCNRCHQTFRVPVKVAPDREPGERDT